MTPPAETADRRLATVTTSIVCRPATVILTTAIPTTITSTTASPEGFR